MLLFAAGLVKALCFIETNKKIRQSQVFINATFGKKEGKEKSKVNESEIIK